MAAKWRRLLALGVALISSVAFVNVVAAPSDHAWLSGPNGTGGGPTPEQILGSGSDTTIILMENIDGLYLASEGCQKFSSTTKPLDFSCVVPNPAGTLFTENYEHDQVHEADFVGSSTGIKQLCSQGQAGVAYIDYARSSRAPKTGDCTGLHFVAYARDGISVEAHNDGTAASGMFNMNNTSDTGLCTGLGWCLTTGNAQHIWGNGCTINNWNQIGSPLNAPIVVYTPQSGSGTRSQFETFLGIPDSSVCATAAHSNVPENQNTGIAAGDINTFMFEFSFALYSTEVNSTGSTSTPNFFLSEIDGVAVSNATIADGTFPFGRNVYNVFCSTSAATTCGDQSIHPQNHMVTQKTVDYIGEEGWICKPGANTQPNWATRVEQNIPALDNTAGAQFSIGPHHISPHYQLNWHDIINQKITRQGFGPFANGVINGGDTNSDYCRLTTT